MITFDQLRAANMSRVQRWHGNAGLAEWSLSDWATATAGELGEAAEVISDMDALLRETTRAMGKAMDNIKKLNRVRDGLVGNKKTPDELKAALSQELADVQIYLDLLSARAGVDLGRATAEKFNAVSIRNGFPDRL